MIKLFSLPLVVLGQRYPNTECKQFHLTITITVLSRLRKFSHVSYTALKSSASDGRKTTGLRYQLERRRPTKPSGGNLRIRFDVL